MSLSIEQVHKSHPQVVEDIRLGLAGIGQGDSAASFSNAHRRACAPAIVEVLLHLHRGTVGFLAFRRSGVIAVVGRGAGGELGKSGRPGDPDGLLGGEHILAGRDQAGILLAG